MKRHGTTVRRIMTLQASKTTTPVRRIMTTERRNDIQIGGCFQRGEKKQYPVLAGRKERREFRAAAVISLSHRHAQEIAAPQADANFQAETSGPCSLTQDTSQARLAAIRRLGSGHWRRALHRVRGPCAQINRPVWHPAWVAL